MKTTPMEAELAAQPLFRELPAPYLDLVAGCAENETFEAGVLVFREGGDADRFWVLRHGDVAIEAHAPGRGALTIATVHEGEMLGWSWLVPPHRYTFDARTRTLVRAIRIDGACLRRKCAENHDLGYELMKRVALSMADRLAQARMQLLDLYAT